LSFRVEVTPAAGEAAGSGLDALSPSTAELNKRHAQSSACNPRAAMASWRARRWPAVAR
jgi:hypothetical protein